MANNGQKCSNYLLIWDLNEPHELGGGLQYENYGSVEALTDRVNELHNKFGKKFLLTCACEVKYFIAFKPVEKITRWEADIIN